MLLRPRVRYQHWIFKLPLVRRYQGMVVARTILFKDAKTEVAPALLRHELVHLKQIGQHGIIRFYLIYFRDYLANLWRLHDHDAAYRHVRFEREARELERPICANLDTANRHP
jgi:penicillin-binding protein-related factor A (putative recombinase)